MGAVQAAAALKKALNELKKGPALDLGGESAKHLAAIQKAAGASCALVCQSETTLRPNTTAKQYEADDCPGLYSLSFLSTSRILLVLRANALRAPKESRTHGMMHGSAKRRIRQ